MDKGRVSFHLINNEWFKVNLPAITDRNAQMDAQIILRRNPATQVIILNGDGTGYQVRPIVDPEERKISQSDMVMLTLTAEDLLK